MYRFLAEASQAVLLGSEVGLHQESWIEELLLLNLGPGHILGHTAAITGQDGKLRLQAGMHVLVSPGEQGSVVTTASFKPWINSLDADRAQLLREIDSVSSKEFSLLVASPQGPLHLRWLFEGSVLEEDIRLRGVR